MRKKYQKSLRVGILIGMPIKEEKDEDFVKDVKQLL